MNYISLVVWPVDYTLYPICQDWQTDSTHAKHGTQHSLLSQFSFYFFCPPRILILRRICVCVCIYIYIYTHISDCKKAVYEAPLLPNNMQAKHFYTNQERCEGLTKCLSFKHQPGRDWVNIWHWTGHFTIPTIKSWPEYPNENQMSIQFPVQQLQCFCNDSWMDRTGPFCSHCVCCSLSANLRSPYPQKAKQMPSYRSDDYNGINWTIPFPWFQDSFSHFKIS
jgi:hypothetical protein